jgi:hypothetical protein
MIERLLIVLGSIVGIVFLPYIIYLIFSRQPRRMIFIADKDELLLVKWAGGFIILLLFIIGVMIVFGLVMFVLTGS